MKFEKQYHKLLEQILDYGSYKPNRTGIGAYTLPHHMIQHDMSKGFPLMTTKKMGIKSIAAELEFFIKGLTDKKWLKDRKCNIWNEWCNPKIIPGNLTEDERKKFQLKATDLGPVYGYQWRNFNSQDYDQLKSIITTLKENKNDRRMVCSAWNPNQINEQALPPCHVLWHVTVIDNKLHLCWFQRSCDVFLGIPYNIASYAILLKLIAKETGLEEGILTGFLSDVHVYENHVDQARMQLDREILKAPTLNIPDFTNIFDWKYTDLELTKYKFHPAIKAKVAV